MDMMERILNTLYFQCFVSSLFVVLGMRMMGIGNMKYNVKTIFGLAFILFAVAGVLKDR